MPTTEEILKELKDIKKLLKDAESIDEDSLNAEQREELRKEELDDAMGGGNGFGVSRDFLDRLRDDSLRQGKKKLNKLIKSLKEETKAVTQEVYS